MSIAKQSFYDLLNSLHDFKSEQRLALALSGGGDSMALAFLLAGYAKKHKIELHLLTVDHGLRSGSKKEAQTVAAWVKDWPHVTHKILTWKGDKPKTRIQEEARKARYALMSEYCRKQKIGYLFLAHHGDDQVETFLFRLAKGSGLDGLGVMPVLQKQKDVTLVRPCLEFSHEDLIAVCKKNRLDWIEDPSNDADRFARVRLRRSKAVLEHEGLTSSRIITLAKRLGRAGKALSQVADMEEKNCLIKKEPRRIEFDAVKFKALPQEIGLRLLQKALLHAGPSRAYPAGLQNLEKIVGDIHGSAGFKASTLGGCIIRLKKAKGIIEVVTE